MLRARLLAAALLLLPVAAPAQTIGGALPPPLPLFPPDNWWNLDVSGAPVDPGSAGFIAFINNGGSRHLHPDFGGEVSPGSVEIYGMPYVVVPGTQPKVPVQFVEYGDESDPGPYPIPSQAITQVHWIEGGEPGNQDPGGDRHMLIVDYDNKILYELYHAFYNGSTWTAGSGAIFDTKTNNRRPEDWTSADAAGLAILPGLVRYDEADTANPDEIRHAFRVTVRSSNGHVYPASHSAGSTSGALSGALPMGARLRLKPSVDISGFSAQAQKIFRAMKTYGLIVADNGTDMYVGGTFDTRWNNDDLNPAFGALAASDFEVIELGYQPAFPTVSIGDAMVAEGTSGTTPAEFTVSLSTASTQTVTVDYATGDGTATASGGDYVPTSGTLIFAPGTTEQTVSVAVAGDTMYEGDETFVVALSNPLFATLADGQGQGTIANDDPEPTLSVGDVSVTEGDLGGVPAVFAVSLSAPSGLAARVHFATADGTAAAGSDYAATSGILAFPPGTTTRTVRVLVRGDFAAEADETFTLNLSNPFGAAIADGTAVGTIVDNDALPGLVLHDRIVPEGDTGTTSAVFAVSLSAPSASVVTVSYSTVDGSARAGADYLATTGTLTFPPWTTLQTLNVPVVGDNLVEADESFLVRLSGPVNAKISRGEAFGIIRDDDRRGLCTPIRTIPFVIREPGRYCLARSLSAPLVARPAITVAADSVAIDLGGFTLADTSGTLTQGYGIFALGHKGITVSHGTLRGFFTGVYLGPSSADAAQEGHAVVGVAVVGSTGTGIRVEGRGNRIVANHVSRTRGTTLYGADADAFGIVAIGPGLLVSSNVVSSTVGAGGGSGRGITLASADGAKVLYNRVSNATLAASTGIAVDASTGVTVNENRLSTLSYGIVFGGGASGTYSGNVLTAVVTPYVGGTPVP